MKRNHDPAEELRNVPRAGFTIRDYAVAWRYFFHNVRVQDRILLHHSFGRKRKAKLKVRAFMRVRRLRPVRLALPFLYPVGHLNAWRLFEYSKAILYLGALRGETALEIGASSGSFGPWLARNGAVTVCVDLDENEIRSAAAGMTSAPRMNFAGSLHYVVADARALPFKPDAFSRVASISALEHVPENLDAALAEIHRVTAAGGVCVVSLPFRAAGAPPRRLPYYTRFFTDADLAVNVTNPLRMELTGLYKFGGKLTRSFYARPFFSLLPVKDFFIGVVLHIIEQRRGCEEANTVVLRFRKNG
ncbi:MAG: class I SAM-dependent methyltransferase [bacterium]